MSQLGLVVRCSAGKRKDLGSTLRFGSPFSSKLVVYGHCLTTLPCTMNETLTWLTSLPVIMRKSFWWRLCSIGCKLPLGSYILGFRSLCLSQKWHRTLKWFNELEYVYYIYTLYGTHSRKGSKVAGTDTSFWPKKWETITVSSTRLSYFNWPECFWSFKIEVWFNINLNFILCTFLL